MDVVCVRTAHEDWQCRIDTLQQPQDSNPAALGLLGTMSKHKVIAEAANGENICIQYIRRRQFTSNMMMIIYAVWHMHANKIAKLQRNLSSTPENYLGSSGGQVHHATTWNILQMAKL